MILISLAKDQVISWLLETEKEYGLGWGCPLRHEELWNSGFTVDMVDELIAQPWMKARESNRMWTEDRDALFDWLVAHGILSVEQRMWLDARHALALMEG